jgi:hypothetical protein
MHHNDALKFQNFVSFAIYNHNISISDLILLLSSKMNLVLEHIRMLYCTHKSYETETDNKIFTKTQKNTEK